jgi:hypothetical protein
MGRLFGVDSEMRSDARAVEVHVLEVFDRPRDEGWSRQPCVDMGELWAS